MMGSAPSQAASYELALPPISHAPSKGTWRWLQSELRCLWGGLKGHVRALTSGRDLECLQLSSTLQSANFVVISTIRNEADRLDFFIRHYRDIGFEEFVFIDNGSTDTSVVKLEGQPHISLFRSRGEYAKSRYGNDWVNNILQRYASEKWILYVDADEIFVYSEYNKININSVADSLLKQGLNSMPCLMVDMYSDRKISENIYVSGQDPLTICSLFDAGDYYTRYDPVSKVAWTKGGVRSRVFFSQIWDGPALNKTPLVRWKRHFVFLKSSHELWPPSLNSHTESIQVCKGCLLHFKFLAPLCDKVLEESKRLQHTDEYAAYQCIANPKEDEPSLIGPSTAQYKSWHSLVEHGLLQAVDWVVPQQPTPPLRLTGDGSRLALAQIKHYESLHR